MDALLRRRAMIAAGGGEPPTPPGPVVSVQYIRGGGDGSYIDTGITPDSTTRVIVWARNWNPSARMLFGSNDSGQHFWISAHNNARVGQIGVAYGAWASPYNYSDDVFSKLSGYHKYELYQGVLKIDGVAIYTNSNSFTGNSNNIYLFGRNNSGALDGLVLPADICACQIYKNDVLVRDYTPVNSPSIGLYDAVSDTVFTNAGSGSFTYGTFNSNAYTPLEYIAASGDSHFITPAIGSYSLPIVTKFRPTSTSATWFSPIGGRDGNERCDIFTGNTTHSNCRLYACLGTGDSQQIYSSTTAGAVRNKDLTVVKNNNTFTAYYNNAAFGSAVSFNIAASYSTGALIAVGATWSSDTSSFVSHFVGNIYYAGLGEYNLVPAKVNGVAGMYDTYNDTFYPSTTSTPFSSGPEL